jgi:SagB-type dehydrogenase family enzyme
MIPSGRAETATRERSALLPALLGMLLIVHWAAACGPTLEGTAETAVSPGQAIALPHPSIDGPTSVEAALASRRSRRVFGATPLTLAEAGQLLWAAQGATDQRGQRTAPSAGGLYPLDVYLVAGGVEGLEPAVYGYSPAEHALRLVVEGDRRADLGRAALDQDAVREAPATIVLAAVYERTTGKYGGRGRQYVHMEVGAAAENVYLQAEALALGTVLIGAFHDERVQELLQLRGEQRPLALLPVGHLPAEE